MMMDPVLDSRVMLVLAVPDLRSVEQSREAGPNTEIRPDSVADSLLPGRFAAGLRIAPSISACSGNLEMG
jgi:hypothetical protein